MDLQVHSYTETRYDPIFLAVLEDIPGGATLGDDVKSTTTELLKGTVVGKDGSTDGLYRIIKSAEVYEDVASGNNIKVLTNHEFKVGDFLCNNEKSSAITAIDTDTSDDYDIITVTSGFACSDGDVLYQGTSEGLTAAAVTQKYIPCGITIDNVQFIKYDRAEGEIDMVNVSVAVCVRGTVDESELPYPVSDEAKTSLTDRIRFA